MAYSNACFISYKRPPQNMNLRAAAARSSPKHIWLEFVEKFEQLLTSRLTTPLNRIFRDDDLDSDPGKPYPDGLSTNLCRSVCMVALLVPEYIESSWCVAEWKAMEGLEAKRLNGQLGLIIPVIFQGKKEDLTELFGKRQCIELSGLLSPSRELNKKENLKKITDIANTINRYVKKFATAQAECDGFRIPVGAEENTPKIVEPSPFQR
jgi:hypothetical protein